MPIYNLNHINESQSNYNIKKSKNKYRLIVDGKEASHISYYDYNIKNFDWILVANVETKKQYRRHGYAEILINELYKDISTESHGEKGLYLLVKVDNTPAINLYKKLKFFKIRHHEIKGEEYIIMAKGKRSKFKQFEGIEFSG